MAEELNVEIRPPRFVSKHIKNMISQDKLQENIFEEVLYNIFLFLIQ